MNIEIHLACLDDAVEILALQYLAYRSEAILYDDWSLPPLKQTLEELKAEFNSHKILKASVDNKIIGSVRAQLKDGTCHIGRLIVHPDYRRRGIGSRLMTRIEEFFSAARRFELFTGSKSEGNIRLYESLGYKIFRKADLSANVTLVFLEKAKRV